MVWLLRDAGLLLPCSGVQWSAVTAGCQEPGEPSLERLELAPARQLAKSRWRMPETMGLAGLGSRWRSEPPRDAGSWHWAASSVRLVSITVRPLGWAGGATGGAQRAGVVR